MVLPTKEALDKLVLDPVLRSRLGLPDTALGLERSGQTFIRAKWEGVEAGFTAAVAVERLFESMGLGVKLLDMSTAQKIRILAKNISDAERIEEDIAADVYDYLEPEELNQLTRLSDFDSKIVYIAQRARLQSADLVITGGNSYEGIRAEQNPGAMTQPTKSGPVERDFVPYEGLVVFTR